MSDADGYRLDVSDEESASNLLLRNHFYDKFPEMTEETSPVALPGGPWSSPSLRAHPTLRHRTVLPRRIT